MSKLWLIPIALFLCLSEVAHAAPSGLKLPLGRFYEVPLEARVQDIMVSDETRVLVEWREDALVIFAVGLGMAQVRWQQANDAIQTLDITVVPEHRDVLMRFLDLYLESDRLLRIESNGQIWLQGEVNQIHWARYQQLAKAFPELNVEQLTIKEQAPEMIELEVNVVEIRRRFLRTHGLAWSPSASGPALGLLSDWLGGGTFRMAGDSGAGWQPNAEQLAQSLAPGTRGYFGWQTSLSSTLRLLEERGEATLLASPKLSVLSGETTDFLAGGEIPLPQVNADGQMQVSFHPYGIRVLARPTRLENGHIQASIEAEVSSLDAAVAVQGIPGLLTRKSASTVTVVPGETLVLSGLRSRESQFQRSGLPMTTSSTRWFARNVFGQIERGHQETEMMVFITPRLLQEEKNVARTRQVRRETLQNRLATAQCRGMSYQNF